MERMAVVYGHAHFLHVSSFAPNQNPNYTSNNLKFLTSTLQPKVFTSARCLAASSKDSGKITASEEEVDDLGVKAALSVLGFYKREISPLLPKSCRYVPSCSEYSMEAYKKYGVAKGSVLTVWRLCRCNPLGGSGFDPPRWFDEPSPAEED